MSNRWALPHNGPSSADTDFKGVSPPNLLPALDLRVLSGSSGYYWSRQGLFLPARRIWALSCHAILTGPPPHPLTPTSVIDGSCIHLKPCKWAVSLLGAGCVRCGISYSPGYAIKMQWQLFFFNLNLFVYFCKKFSILKVISGCGYAHAMGRSGDVFPKSGAED